ncbi:MAG TPA: site-specific DNA-methyltransferase [Armatimonadota bacterium]|nr:site-specific DNA-methyltransferase [Armatimonadota bacterium]
MQCDRIINGDSIEVLRGLPSGSFHLILSDIPYGIGAEDWDVLHNNTNSAYRGSSPAQKEAGEVFKARGKPLNGWSDADRKIPIEYYNWCASWASEWLRVLKPGGSAIVFAGRRLSHRCVSALEDAGFTYKDMLAWLRARAPHRAQRLSAIFRRRGDDNSELDWQGWRVGNLRPTFEPILWFTKPYKIGTTIADNAKAHGVGGYNEEAFLKFVSRPDNIVDCDFAPGERGNHPTQKPVKLMQALIELTTQPQQLVLDPYCGCGSTLIAARNCERRFIGIEIDPKYCEIAQREIDSDLFYAALMRDEHAGQ